MKSAGLTVNLKVLETLRFRRLGLQRRGEEVTNSKVP